MYPLRITSLLAVILTISTWAAAQRIIPTSLAGDRTATGPWDQNVVEHLDGAEVVSHQVIVGFMQLPGHDKSSSAKARSESILQIVKSEDIDLHRPVGGAGAELFESRSKDVATLRTEIASRPDVKFVEPNYRGHQLTTIPNDPDFGQQWALHNTGQNVNGVIGTAGADIGATSAWDLTTGSTANVVAIIDSGIYPGHPDLAGNLWSSPKAFSVNIGGTQYNCGVGAQGFDTYDKPESCLSTNLADYSNGHGTAVAGIIGAVGNNSTGVSGVNWVASMMIVRAIASDGSLNTADAIDAINFVVQAKTAGAANVRVINASWFQGSTDLPSSEALYNEVMLANGQNILFVAAAGNSSENNDNNPSYPASFANPNCIFLGAGSCYAPNVISVAMTNSQDVLDPTSNYGPSSVTLGAPGVSIYSTLLNNGYGFEGLQTPGTGTSFAAPQVSGSAALVLSYCSGLTVADLKFDVLSTVDINPSLQGKTITGGRLDVNNAVRSCAPTKLAGTGVNGGGTGWAWTNPQNVASTTSYATVGVGGHSLASQWDEVTQFGFSVPAGKTITGISVGLSISATSIQATGLSLILVKNGVPVGTRKDLPAVPTAQTYLTFGRSSDLWGSSFSPNDVNSSGFGVWVSVGVGRASHGSSFSLNDVKITVFTN